MEDLIRYYPLPSLLKASWQAGVLILLVLAVQWAFGRRLNPRWRYGLWLLVVIRLALPWTIPSPVSLFNFLRFPQVAASLGGERATPGSPSPAAHYPTAAIQTEQPVGGSALQPAAGGSRLSLSLYWLVGVWAAGALTLAIYLWVTHYRLARRVTMRRPLIDEPMMNLLEDCKQEMGVRVPVALVESGEVGSPSLFGFVRPRLLLPTGLAKSFSLTELRYVFLHELSHIKRRDILVGWVVTVLQILHWFNPLVWLAFHRMRVDRELACDALSPPPTTSRWLPE
jgi:beta-lactamase regulating signal transducer with metallopeptidase domain